MDVELLRGAVIKIIQEGRNSSENMCPLLRDMAAISKAGGPDITPSALFFCCRMTMIGSWEAR